MKVADTICGRAGCTSGTTATVIEIVVTVLAVGAIVGYFAWGGYYKRRRDDREWVPFDEAR